jgi:ubiquinol-cytochrome c reductase iron-sulfur subunit
MAEQNEIIDMPTPETGDAAVDPEETSRRDFIVMAATGIACAGMATSAIPLLGSLSPSADVLAVGSTEVDLSRIKEGENITVMWRGAPIFISHRTAEQIKAARDVDIKELRDPQKDEDRVKIGKEEWLITVGICTHLGCVPLGHKGDFGGWLCPCHGSHYDSSGRIRKGPAPLNLAIPSYEFISDKKIKIG